MFGLIRIVNYQIYLFKQSNGITFRSGVICYIRFDHKRIEKKNGLESVSNHRKIELN